MSLRAVVWYLFAALTPTQIFADSLPSNDASLLWGPYRPNLYLGIRPRVPQSVFMGLMWAKSEQVEHSLRHTCEQSDDLSYYGWDAYDTRHGGTQSIEDPANNIHITTEYVKVREGPSAGNWALRVRGKPIGDAATGLRTSVVFYVGMEAMQTCAKCHLEAAVEKRRSGDYDLVEQASVRLRHPKLGGAVIHIPHAKVVNEAGGSEVEESIFVHSLNTTEEILWQSKSIFLNLLKDTKTAGKRSLKALTLSNNPGLGNMHFVQMVFKENFEFDILYSSQEATRDITSGELTHELQSTQDTFESRFASVFQPQKPFDDMSHLQFSQQLFSNLLGELGYFHGDSKVDNTSEFIEDASKFWEKAVESRKHGRPQSAGPYELFTHVPSRPNIPHGSLWSEGFHLMPVIERDADLAMEVIHNWLMLMDGQGWLAREQMLGPEARSKVPEDSQTQYPHIASAPTLFWVVERFVDMLSGRKRYTGHHSEYLTQPQKAQDLLAEIYPLLKRHYEWFRRSQSGNIETHSIPQASLDEGYRWRGRIPECNMASGLDDYPRAEPPDITELHLDALCWVGLMASVLEGVSVHLDMPADAATYRSQHKDIAHNLEAVHWYETESMYCDTRVWEGAHFYTCPKGYVALFPFLTGFLGPNHANLNATLDLIRDPDSLWTRYGIRSLGPDSTRYGVGSNRWRGPVWININYLIIKRLLELARQPGPAQQKCRDMYRELRRNVADAVFKSWQETGYAHERYNQDSGKGQGAPHFTGWTALVVMVMAFPDLEDEAGGEGFKGRIGGFVGDAGRERAWSLGTVVVGVALVGFLYGTRRRSAGLIRALLSAW